MRKALAVALLALLGFYGAWPLWTGYQIRQAIETEDAALLERKVDFPSVRASLQPVLTSEASAYLERLKRDVGPLGGLIAGTVKGDVVNKLVESALATTITPPQVIRMLREGRSFKQSLEKVVGEQAGGGLRLPPIGAGKDVPSKSGPSREQPGEPAGPAKQASASSPPTASPSPNPAGVPTPDTGGERRKPLSLANVKSFVIEGPLAFTVGLARDGEAQAPEVAATLRFSGFDWKIVAVTPDFDGRRQNKAP